MPWSSSPGRCRTCPASLTSLVGNAERAAALPRGADGLGGGARARLATHALDIVEAVRAASSEALQRTAGALPIQDLASARADAPHDRCGRSAVAAAASRLGAVVDALVNAGARAGAAIGRLQDLAGDAAANIAARAAQAQAAMDARGFVGGLDDGRPGGRRHGCAGRVPGRNAEPRAAAGIGDALAENEALDGARDAEHAGGQRVPDRRRAAGARRIGEKLLAVLGHVTSRSRHRCAT